MNLIIHSVSYLSQNHLKPFLWAMFCFFIGLSSGQSTAEAQNCPTASLDVIVPVNDFTGNGYPAYKFYHKDGTNNNVFYKDETIYSYGVQNYTVNACISPSAAAFRTPIMPASFAEICTAANSAVFWSSGADGCSLPTLRTCQKVGPVQYVHSRVQHFQATATGDFTVAFNNSNGTTVNLTILERYAVYTDCGNLAGNYVETGTQNSKKKFVDSDNNELYYDATNTQWVISGSMGIAYKVASTADAPPLTGWQVVGSSCVGANCKVAYGEYVPAAIVFAASVFINNGCLPHFNGTYYLSGIVDERPVYKRSDGQELKFNKTALAWEIGAGIDNRLFNTSPTKDVPTSCWKANVGSASTCDLSTINFTLSANSQVVNPVVMCVKSGCGTAQGTYTQTGTWNERPDLKDDYQNRLYYWGAGDPTHPEGWYIRNSTNVSLFYNSSTNTAPPTTGWQAFMGDGSSCTGSIEVNEKECPCLASVSIVANPSGSIGAGMSVTFTATPTNGGTTPSYQWKKNGNDVGTNSATYTDAALANGDKVTCVMTSNATCVSTPTATSNEIPMVVCPIGGETWTAHTAAEANSWRSVTYGNGLFVAVAASGANRVMTSPDGVNWTARTAAENNLWVSVIYANGLFVAVATDGANRVMTSPDGINWTARTAAAASQWYSVTYGNGLFVAVAVGGDNRVMTSPDGINWTARTAVEANEWTSVTYGNGLFVAVAVSGSTRVMTSPDGINWTARTAVESSRWFSVTYGNGLYVAVAQNGTNRVMTSSDGINWTARTAAVPNEWRWVTYGGGLFVAIAEVGVSCVMCSRDGINWVARTIAEDSPWVSLIYGNGLFVAIAADGANRVVTSPGGDTPAVSIVSNDADNNIINGTSVTFTATPTNGGTTPSYIWKKNNVTIPNETGATLTTTTLANGDKIKVEMTSSDVCVSPATATSDEITMTVILCVSPTTYNVTGGGSYCSGGSGSVVGLSSSQTGVNYQLKKGSVNIGSAVAGTGNALTFGNQMEAGTYTVEATTATGGCVASMSGNAVVTINTLPSLFSVTGGGSFCPGGSGVLVGLSGSESGVSYQLKKGDVLIGNALSGTGSSISFGNQTDVGTYTVVATNTSTSCVTSMTGSASVTTYALPTAVVSGTSLVCKGGSAVTVTFTGSNGVAPYTFSYQVNGGSVQTVATTGGSASATVNQSTSTAGIYTYTLVSVRDANCSQTQTGSAVVTVQTKPTIVLNTLQQTFNEGNTQVLCDTDANPENGLQFTVSGSCVTGSPVWRVQVGGGSWSEWSATAPVTQSSNNQPHRYQAACDASCPVTYTSPIELTINYRASVPQNVSLLADGVTVAAGETKDICNIEGNELFFKATCATGETVVYSVDGGEYSGVVPTQLVDGNYHNYRVRCRKLDGTASCIETESGVLRLRITSLSQVPVASLNVTSGCGTPLSFSGSTSCGNLASIWYNASTNVSLSTLPVQTPSETTSYYARCQTEYGCVSEKSNVVTFTVTPIYVAPIVTVSQDVVCTGTTVTVSANCPAGSTTSWNTGVSTPSFEVAFSNVTKQSYWAKCVFEGGCQSAESNRKEVSWKAFVVSLINIGESKSGIKSNDRAAWSSQFVTRDGGPELDQSTQQSPTLYYVENVNKQAPRYWTIHADACALGTNGSLTFDMLATPEMGVIRSFNTHENNAPYFMYANREGWTELYAQNHPAYGFYQDNGAGGNVYDAGLPKGLYKLSIRYWDMKGWGSIYPSTRKPQGNVLAYQEYWFRIQSKDGVGVGAARTAVSGEEEVKGKGQGSDNGKQLTDNVAFATVMPNPVTNILRLKVQDSKGQMVQTTLTDAAGRHVLSRQFTPETNMHQEEFGVSELPTGMYFLKVTTSDKQATLKVVKVD
ncbi:hypothetical protein FHS57_002563 [Runella defluvii]|uniref:Secretion system C-terminal sorting domain-containing protein n=1 Tax=Runella defluvii TaxID=370973 RepID=A0A7W6EQJ0_9BACT|nr:T9SS type A sorting domain-containing protein [Runella defluvii]MBB3838558.1 hypothetical protein [Runella defluvii]